MTTPQESYRMIALDKGLFAKVDADVFEGLNKHRYHARWNSKTKSFYATRNSAAPRGQSRLIYMHREILGLMPGDKRHGDHALHDTLDNRKFVDGKPNLRIATAAQNAMNRRSSHLNQTGFKGVHHKKNRRGERVYWAAVIKFGGKQRTIGFYPTAEDAARAYDAAALLHYGEFAYLNFPKESSNEILP